MNDSLNKDITHHNDMMMSLFLTFFLFLLFQKGLDYIVCLFFLFLFFLMAQIDLEEEEKKAFGYSDLTLFTTWFWKVTA